MTLPGKQVCSYYFLKIALILRADLGTQGIRCDLPGDVHPYAVLQEDPVDGPDLSSKGGCVSKSTPQDKTGTDYASNPSPVQHLSSVSGDHPQSRAVTPDSVSEEQLARAVPATGLEIDAHSCQAEPRACAGESSPNYGLGALRRSGSRTGLPPDAGTSSDGEMTLAGTVSQLNPTTVDIHRQRNSASAPFPVSQGNADAGSVSPLLSVTESRDHRGTMDHENSEEELSFVSCDVRRYVGGNEELSSALPNNEREFPSFKLYQPASQMEQPEQSDLAMQTGGGISNGELHNHSMACVTAAAPSIRTDDIHMSAEPAPQPMPKKKRAYSRRTRTGCITCRRRKKKCEEHQPLCMWTSFTPYGKKALPIQNASLTKSLQVGIVYEAICDVRAMTHDHYG